MASIADAVIPGRKAKADKLTANGIRERYDKGTKALQAEVRNYWINSAFIDADQPEQWVWWDDSTNRLETLEHDPARPRLTVDRLLSSSRTIIAKLLRRPLVFEVQAKSADDATVTGARIAEGAIADVHREHGWEDLRRRAAWAAWKGGTAILATEWDPAGGEHLGETEAGKSYGTGDTTECALSIAEVAWEPGSRNPERGQWWIKAAALPPSEVKERYGLKEMPKADASAALSPLQQRLLHADRGPGTGDRPSDLCLVLTYYERPNKDRPEGACAVVVGETLVDGPHPWRFPFKNRLNMVIVRETVVENRGTGITILSRAVPVQLALNSAHTNIEAHMQASGLARLAVPEGSDADQYTDDPADIVKFLPGPDNKPFYLTPPNMPAWWVQRPDLLERAIDDILGVHDISRGEAPANVDSGVALTLLADQDDTPLGALSREMAEAFGRHATNVLEIYAANVTETRTARVEQPGRPPEEMAFTGKDFAGQTTASVPLEAVAPRSQAAQMQLAMTLWDRKIITDPKQFARFAELPGADDFTAGLDPDVAKARRENHAFVTCKVAEFPAPVDFDDHAKHIDEHNRFRKSARYEQLDEERRQLIDLHIWGHHTMSGEEMGAQVARAMESPAFAAAAQQHQPPMAGDAEAAAAMPTGPMGAAPMSPDTQATAEPTSPGAGPSGAAPA